MRGQNPVNPGVRGNKSVEVAKTKTRSPVGAADGANHQGPGWNFVRSKNLRSVDLALAIQTDKPRADRIAGQGRCFSGFGGAGILNGSNDLAITRAAAKHAADRIHHRIFARSGTALQ